MLIGWQMQFISLEYTCCIWNRWLETHVLNCFNCTSVQIHYPFEIRFKSSSTIWPEWLLYQCLYTTDIFHFQAGKAAALSVADTNNNGDSDVEGKSRLHLLFYLILFFVLSIIYRLSHMMLCNVWGCCTTQTGNMWRILRFSAEWICRWKAHSTDQSEQRWKGWLKEGQT